MIDERCIKYCKNKKKDVCIITGEKLQFDKDKNPLKTTECKENWILFVVKDELLKIYDKWRQVQEFEDGFTVTFESKFINETIEIDFKYYNFEKSDNRSVWFYEDFMSLPDVEDLLCNYELFYLVSHFLIDKHKYMTFPRVTIKNKPLKTNQKTFDKDNMRILLEEAEGKFNHCGLGTYTQFNIPLDLAIYLLRKEIYD